MNPCIPIGDDSEEWQAIPSTPKNFSQLFPSYDTLFLHLNNEAEDDNITLSVATATSEGIRPLVQLFCLKLQDIRRREFSLRRYHRSSKREVCHTSRVHRRHVRKRTRVRRSISNSISSIHSMSSGRRSSASSRMSSQVSSSSGAGSEAFQSNSIPARNENFLHRPSSPEPTNQIKMTFSSHTHVDLFRKGKGFGKRKYYKFDYWGTKYHWRRRIEDGPFGVVIQYSLYEVPGQSLLAQIRVQQVEEVEGHDPNVFRGWLPHARMRIVHEKIIFSGSKRRDIPE